MTPTPAQRTMREKIERLRQVMPEDEIFLLDMYGRPCLSPKAARKLAETAWAEQEAWRDEHRGQAAEAAANILNIFQGEAA